MFDLSLVELAVCGLVALLVLGPDKLPRAARTAGMYLRRARQSWYSVKADIERELAADELKRDLQRDRDAALGQARALRHDLEGRLDSGDRLDGEPPAGRDGPPK